MISRFSCGKGLPRSAIRIGTTAVSKSKILPNVVTTVLVVLRPEQQQQNQQKQSFVHSSCYQYKKSAFQGLHQHSSYSSFSSSSSTTTRAMSTSNHESPLHCVHVYIKVKPGMEDDFIRATMENATLSSTTEEGVVRFDVYRDQEMNNEFVLVEVYTNSTTAPAAHKETSHYMKWRDVVAPMMLEERTRRLFHNLYPTSIEDWKYTTTTTTKSTP